jgi:hypothetical protein
MNMWAEGKGLVNVDASKTLRLLNETAEPLSKPARQTLLVVLCENPVPENIPKYPDVDCRNLKRMIASAIDPEKTAIGKDSVTSAKTALMGTRPSGKIRSISRIALDGSTFEMIELIPDLP